MAKEKLKKEGKMYVFNRTKYVVIYRVTSQGLKQASGKLIECRGYQFCFCEDEDNYYYLIELSTGMSVGSFDVKEWQNQGFTAQDACEALRDRVALANESFEEGVNKAIVTLNESGYEYPVNKPITKIDNSIMEKYRYSLEKAEKYFNVLNIPNSTFKILTKDIVKHLPRTRDGYLLIAYELRDKKEVIKMMYYMNMENGIIEKKCGMHSSSFTWEELAKQIKAFYHL